MASKEKAAGKPATGKKGNLPPRSAAEYKYNVATLAKDLDLQPASVRVGLRKHQVETNADGVYGWNNQKDYEGVLGKLKQPVKASEKPKAKVKAAGTEKPKTKAVPKKKAA